MIIKKVKTSNIPDVNGAIVDSLTANVDTTTNAPSIRAVNEKLTELDANTATAISEMLDEIAGQKGYITSSEADTKIDSKLSNYLPKSGGTLTGELTTQTVRNEANWFWKGKKNFYLVPTGNEDEWSFDIGSTTDGGVASNTGTYAQFWSMKNQLPIIQFHNDDMSIRMPNGSVIANKDYQLKRSDASDVYYYSERTDTGTKVAFGVGSGGINHGIWSFPLNKWILYADKSNAYLQGHATTAGTATEAHRPVSYAMHGATGSARWCHLGTFTSWGDASNAVIRFRGGNGYNAGVTQNSWFDIHIKDGWQETGSTTSAFGVSIIGMNYNGCSFSIRATAHNVCQVWVYFPWSYWNGDYTFTGRGGWTHVGSNQTSAPTDGVAQPIAWWDVPTAPDFTVRELRMGSIDTWNANYGSYGGGTVMFCW